MSFTSLFFFRILNRPYAAPRFCEIIFQRVRTFTYFTWEFFWFALLWEFTDPNLHEIAGDGGRGRIGNNLRPKRSSHQTDFIFLLFFLFGLFIIDRDPFLTEPCQTWQIYVHSLQRWVFSCDFRGEFVGTLEALSAMLANISHEAIRSWQVRVKGQMEWNKPGHHLLLWVLRFIASTYDHDFDASETWKVLFIACR